MRHVIVYHYCVSGPTLSVGMRCRERRSGAHWGTNFKPSRTVTRSKRPPVPIRPVGSGTSSSTTMTDESKQKSESEWRAILPPEQFRVLRQKGTERPGTGEYEHHMEQGVYSCAGCGTQLYKSSTKFLAGCGWPAFLDGTCFFFIAAHLCTQSTL